MGTSTKDNGIEYMSCILFVAINGKLNAKEKLNPRWDRINNYYSSSRTLRKTVLDN